ncbi:MAG: MBL fold metallo-hydrolase, partial [Campylobacterota bacterium]|nr:MBL fold metallo-hydrolase [Campylobacterota bacterium]
FISHSHWDHIGGLDSMLELNPDITLFVPESLSKHLIRDLRQLAKEVVVITGLPQRLFDNIYTTGLLGEEMPEQSLIIDGKNPIVLTGCGHFGIENIVKRASSVIGKTIYLAAGGFHLMYSDEEEILETISSLKKGGVVLVSPTHCSGDQAIEMFAKSFGDHYIQGGIGARIIL